MNRLPSKGIGQRDIVVRLAVRAVPGSQCIWNRRRTWHRSPYTEKQPMGRVSNERLLLYPLTQLVTQTAATLTNTVGSTYNGYWQRRIHGQEDIPKTSKSGTELCLVRYV